jgi:ABC-type transport system involved in multi-copper enzyme maturation permease subunit
MNSLRLYADEMLGFVRSKVMIVLIVGLPILITVLRLVQPDTEGMPFFAFTAIIMASVGGTLGAVLLSTSITNERARHVYDLFLVRPVTRPQLLLAKYFAALTVLLATALLSLGVSIIADWIAGRELGSLVQIAIQPIVLSLAGMAIACSVGVLLGVLVDSVAGSAILSVYLGNQLSAVAVLPSVLATDLPVLPIAVGAGLGVGGLVLVIAILVFQRKTL